MKKLSARTAVAALVSIGVASCVMSSVAMGPVGLSSKTVSTVAGQAGVTGSTDGTGTGATFWFPAGMVVVGAYIYFCDSNNSTIRQLNPATGQVTTIAGVAGVASYFDNASYPGPPQLAAYFNHPEGITSDGATYLFVADSGNNLIRRVNLTTYAVDTLAGNIAATPQLLDGTGQGAVFNNPLDITCGGGNLYVADSGNSAIRRITGITGTANTGVVVTVAGSPASTTFYWPEGITISGTALYVVDSGNDTVLQVTNITGAANTGVVAPIAGQQGVKGDADGAGLTAAEFNWPEGIAIDVSGNLYVADTLNSVIRELAGGTVTTIAGQGQVTGSANGAGNVATFNHPMRLVYYPTTSGLYVADTYNETIRLVK